MPTLTEADAVTRVEAEVRAYCGWHIAPTRTEELVLDGPDTGVLLLPSLYVTDLASVTVDGTALDPDTYRWSRSGVVTRTGAAGWTDEPRGVVVALTHGHPSMPLDVQTVIDQRVNLAVELSSASQVLSQVGQVRYAVGVSGLRETGLLSEPDRLVLDRYRLPYRL